MYGTNSRRALLMHDSCPAPCTEAAPGFIPDATLGMYGTSRRALRMHDSLSRTLPRPPVVISMSRPARVLAVSGQIYLRPVPARSAANAAITRTLAFLPPVTPRVAPAAPAVSQGGEGAWGEVVPMHQVGSAGAGRRAAVPGTPPARRARAGSSAAAPTARRREARRWRSGRAERAAARRRGGGAASAVGALSPGTVVLPLL